MQQIKFIWMAGGAALAVAGAVVGTITVRAKAEVSAAPLSLAASPIPVVAATKVERSDLARSVSYTAEMRPYEDVDLHAKVAGYLKTINVDIGDRVKAGQVISTLELPEQEADLSRAKADFAIRKLDFDRLDEVAKKAPGLLAQQEIDQARGDFEVAKAALERAKVLTEYAVITAPFDGIITRRYADPGALIQAGTASSSQSMPLVHLAELDRLRLDFPVPQSIAPQIQPGMKVSIEVQATGEKIAGTVARQTDNIDTATRMMRVEVDVKNPDLRLKPGMYATASIDLLSAKQALAVPVQAVQFGDKPAVWMVNDHGILRQQPVTLGLQTPEKVQIVSGVHQGDTVVFGETEGMRAGSKVSVKFVE
jgi:RND family efflux transporter MFP subunit